MGERTFVLAEVIPCPNGWDADCCYDDGRGLNPCGSDRQHCQGNGTAIQVVTHLDEEDGMYSALEDLLDACNCGPDDWKYRLRVGNVMNGGAGTSVYACKKCYLTRAAAIIAEWGTCTAVPR